MGSESIKNHQLNKSKQTYVIFLKGSKKFDFDREVLDQLNLFCLPNNRKQVEKHTHTQRERQNSKACEKFCCNLNTLQETTRSHQMGKGTSSTQKCRMGRDMLVPRRVEYLGCSPTLFHPHFHPQATEPSSTPKNHFALPNFSCVLCKLHQCEKITPPKTKMILQNRPSFDRKW